jgi:hypothetical protein
MAEAQRTSNQVTSLIERFFSAPLDPKFVTSVPHIKSDAIVGLFEAYQEFTESFAAQAKDSRELAPINFRFPWPRALEISAWLMNISHAR